ncbi:uncharacterized protein LOC141856043 [Brevipalpus obovatus]|uniref:uncharacterized protein LOC141856043 n=1 Tax=Brevipalpus obovatus TaxID=246614 RepID=UPI003D9F55A4
MIPESSFDEVVSFWSFSWRVMEAFYYEQGKLKSLRNYFNYQLVFIPYLQENGPRGDRSILFSWIVLITSLCLITKFLILIVINDESIWIYYLCDPFYKLIGARRALNFLLIQWLIAITLAQIFVKLSINDPRKQRWIVVAEALAKGFFHGHGPFHHELKLFNHFTRSQILGCLVTTCFLTLPWFFWTDRSYWAFGIFWMLYHIYASVLIIAFGPNISNLGFFTLYLSGQYIESFIEESEINSAKRRKTSYHLKEVTYFFMELMDIFDFYRPFGNTAFISTFMAQVLVLFYVFFIELSSIIKVVFSVFLVLNFLAGQSTHFFFGSYTQGKIRSYLKSLLKVAKHASPKESLHIVQVLEHLDNRHLFISLASLELSLKSFILTMVETGTFLMLLIANVR